MTSDHIIVDYARTEGVQDKDVFYVARPLDEGHMPVHFSFFCSLISGQLSSYSLFSRNRHSP